MGLDSRGVVLSSGSLPPALLARGAGWGCFHRGGGEVKARGRMEGRVVELRGVERNGERRRDAEVNISIVLFFTWRSAETLKLLVGSFLCSFKDEQIQRNYTHTLPARREIIYIAIHISLGVSFEGWCWCLMPRLGEMARGRGLTPLGGRGVNQTFPQVHQQQTNR